MNIDDYGQQRPTKHREWGFKIDILGMRRRWTDWRSRRRVERERLQEAIEHEERAAADLGEWLRGHAGKMTRDELVERLNQELRERNPEKDSHEKKVS
jgi:hypothetical protein